MQITTPRAVRLQHVSAIVAANDFRIYRFAQNISFLDALAAGGAALAPIAGVPVDARLLLAFVLQHGQLIPVAVLGVDDAAVDVAVVRPRPIPLTAGYGALKLFRRLIIKCDDWKMGIIVLVHEKKYCDEEWQEKDGDEQWEEEQQKKRWKTKGLLNAKEKKSSLY